METINDYLLDSIRYAYADLTRLTAQLAREAAELAEKVTSKTVRLNTLHTAVDPTLVARIEAARNVVAANVSAAQAVGVSNEDIKAVMAEVIRRESR